MGKSKNLNRLNDELKELVENSRPYGVVLLIPNELRDYVICLPDYARYYKASSFVMADDKIISINSFGANQISGMIHGAWVSFRDVYAVSIEEI